MLYFVISDFARSRAEAERLLALARSAADRPLEAAALESIAWAKTWARDLQGAVAAAQAAIGVAESAEARLVLPGAHFTIGWVSAVSGRLDEADANIQQAMTASLDVNDTVYRSLSLSAAGLMRNWTGEFEAAARLQAEGLALARQHDLLVPLLFGFFLYGLTLIGKGDYDEALTALTEGLTLAERVGDEAIHHRLLNCLGWLYADLGDLELATDLNRRSAEVGRRRKRPRHLPERHHQHGRDLPGPRRARPRPGAPGERAPLLPRADDERMDAVPVLDPPVRRAGRGGPASAARRPSPGSTQRAGSIWPRGPGRARTC